MTSAGYRVNVTFTCNGIVVKENQISIIPSIGEKVAIDENKYEVVGVLHSYVKFSFWRGDKPTIELQLKSGWSN
jgi:hypothetical protein